MTQSMDADDGVLAAARARLVPIVDRLIAENPQVVAQYNKVFAGDAGGAQWLTYGLTEKADTISEVVAQPVAPEEDNEDDESLGLTDLFGEITEEDFLEDDFVVEEGDAEIVQL